ncbi:MAG: hypothetical protein KA972_05260, partial [Brachymonas sp.]|nr:hypothetical protein [Brachymonas sp.]
LYASAMPVCQWGCQPHESVKQCAKNAVCTFLAALSDSFLSFQSGNFCHLWGWCHFVFTKIDG